MSQWFSWGSVVIGFVACFLWLKASETVIRSGDKKSKGTVFIQSIDFKSTLEEQGKWNAWAAGVTAIAIGLQTIATIMSQR